MQNRYDNRDFEQLVKQNADQYRMFPSEKVWENIHNTLHVRRRWYGIGITLLLISVTAVTLVMVMHPAKKQQLAEKQTTLVKPAGITQDNPAVQNASSEPAAHNHLQTNQLPAKQPAAVFLSAYNVPVPASEQPVPEMNTANIYAESIAPVLAVNTNNDAPAISRQEKKILAARSEEPKKPEMAARVTVTLPVQTTITDNTNPESTPEAAAPKSVFAANPDLMTIESVVNSYQHISKAKKLSWSLYFTPTISYRELKENKTFLRALQAGTTTPISNVYVPDINSVVTHKPDLGFQLGLTAGYPLSRTLTLTGGLQFTISKYDIKAYSYPREQATITLSNDYGGTNNLSTFTSYRNIGGFKANWLRNLYVSASIPIGLEVKVAGNKKGYVGAGATIQPTYVLDNRSYLLSTDFKNYAEMPSLIRKWNINTGFELFVANNSGKIKWRLGPQARYQTMSSFINRYPVKEHLFDFGFKLGVMLR